KIKDEYRTAWANYFCKYINSYEKEGIPIWGISVQNEPAAKQSWDSCIYTAEEERDFIRDYLGPALESRNLLDKKVIIWDHNRDIMVERARTVLNDPEAAKYVWGTGFHWYNGNHFDAVQQVHDEFPDKELIFTEGCQENGPHIGSWDLGERYATSIINDLNRWTVAWIDWNLILDERGGPNHVGNYCSAPIIVDTRSQDILYQSSYYYLGHFSRFIKRGDKIIGYECKTNDLLTLAAVNASGIVTAVVMNKKDVSAEFKYQNGDTNIPLSIPGRSIVTLIDDSIH
ncbi:MAG: glycoside hydrolase family 30 beta sandwich domain-containing protein, partial [Candidatus Neomarinimicrobiota bacterium]|nr:glycoside hydrolase family 30 beta sandwich domain-containing protein [Candidatus Neomarinimicrobiota bacterium]